jgi:hypothetical protein
MGSGFMGSGFRVQGSGFRVQGSGFRVVLSPRISELLKPPEANEPLNPEPHIANQ